MNKFSLKGFCWSVILSLVFALLPADGVYAVYQKVAPGTTITLGEFVFTDDLVPTMTPCTISVSNPANTEVVASAAMTANANGWHYYDYAIPGNAASGLWPAVMTCGSALNGDLVKGDKSFIVDSTLVTQSSITTAVSTLTAELAKGFTVTLSDFGETTINTAYKAKLQVLNYATVPTDAASLPTVTITDPAGTTQVSGAAMTKASNGTYNYSYSINGSAVGGVWETVVSVVINGETVRVNDFWSLASSPADIQITSIPDKVIPSITASVRIDNMGTSASDFYYVYCIVSSADNLCGGSDDIDSASATVFINPGSFVNLSLTLNDVPAAGTYWFKVKTRALAETLWAASSEQFAAESAAVITPPGGGGGGGGGDIAPPTIPVSSCNGADFNRDSKVNSIDFSILLAFWQKIAPFNNPCVDINKDSKVNSVDFSILLYQWKK